MLRQKVECPHCGNEIVVNEMREREKCHWCRRLLSVKFEKSKGKRFDCIVEPIDFPDDSKPFIKDRKEDFCRF